MAGFLNANLASDDSDEEDDDYNPAADKTAEREDMPQTASPGRGGASNKRRRGAAISGSAPAADSGGADDDGDDNDNGDGGGGADEEADLAAAELLDPRVQAKRAKVTAAWQEINARAAANGSGTQRLPSATVNLAALCRSTFGDKKPKRAEQDAIWMRSLGLLKRPAKPPAAASSLWLPGGSSTSSRAPLAAAAAAAASGSAAAAAEHRGGQHHEEEERGAGGPSTTGEEKRALAAAALAAARDASTAGSRLGKVAVTEVRRFAGKDIQVTVHVDKDSKEAQRAAARATAPPPPPSSSGMDALLAEMDKKKKVSVLDKTKADWSVYKAANTEVDEELETYKKSGEQYLDKQNFLKRAELREYETERDQRLNSDVRTRGRL